MMRSPEMIFLIMLSIAGQACSGMSNNSTVTDSNPDIPQPMTDSTAMKYEIATFGNGCFWCTEAIFESLSGVLSAESGYMGGQTENPTYKEVCNGNTGHAEVIQIKYNSSVISFEELLEAFWSSHDPTTLNRQGNDVGTQYRSVIFFHNEQQEKAAVSLKQELNSKKVFPDPIVTEISPASKFYVAENYHQDYFKLNGNEPYCAFVIRPKLDKFKKAFAEKIKKTQ